MADKRYVIEDYEGSYDEEGNCESVPWVALSSGWFNAQNDEQLGSLCLMFYEHSVGKTEGIDNIISEINKMLTTAQIYKDSLG